jgi:hypothetical protein
VLGSQGDGIWVQSKFSLGLFIGQRVKIRWVAQSWAGFGDDWESYLESPGGSVFDIGTAHDGWWIDEVQVTGAITTQVSPILDTTTIPLTTQCPVGPGAECNQALGTNGFNLDFRLSDADNDGSISAGRANLRSFPDNQSGWLRQRRAAVPLPHDALSLLRRLEPRSRLPDRLRMHGRRHLQRRDRADPSPGLVDTGLAAAQQLISHGSLRRRCTVQLRLGLHRDVDR